MLGFPIFDAVWGKVEAHQQPLYGPRFYHKAQQESSQNGGDPPPCELSADPEKVANYAFLEGRPPGYEALPHQKDYQKASSHCELLDPPVRG